VAVGVRAKGSPLAAAIVTGAAGLALRAVTRHAIDRARKTKEPFFIEAKTYRFRGHSMSDPAKYRTREEVAQWMERDPIGILAKRIGTLGIATPEQLQQIDDEAKATVQDAVAFAESSPVPDAATVADHVEA
jgi:pyruvate dehydrogenase E1 component alpha subunit